MSLIIGLGFIIYGTWLITILNPSLLNKHQDSEGLLEHFGF